MPSYRELLCTKLSTNFREATEIVTHPDLPKANAGHIVVKNKYLGVNATDINVTNGVFNENPPPFGTGLDAVGTVVEVGQGVTEVKVGDYVVYDKFGAYAEYVEVPIGSVHKLPELSPAALPLTVCGISAAGIDIAFETIGGDMFKIVFDNMAIRGRIIVFGTFQSTVATPTLTLHRQCDE
ncbi:hypothetical protein AM588_10000615 [Phytophthora nicotianae]|uniref:Alcohol dehydrogenase-like N-terminal domain-containing protein n=1 Tax=Phytophthora nicotianae TaxID=4792 RepID=A0A0W8CIL5_PHYNI|nr:hypothetical protein AM588_10000615 [Phytophthora nicotianae]